MEKILTLKNPILRQKSEEISEEDISDLILSLTEIVKKYGVGISAPQIGVLKRVSLIKIMNANNEEEIIPLINPTIERISPETTVNIEGCMSLPGIFQGVQRPKFVDINFTTIIDGKKEKTDAVFHDLEAAIVLHEIDHLNGTLFIDRAFNREQRRAFEKKTGVEVFHKEIMDYEID